MIAGSHRRALACVAALTAANLAVAAKLFTVGISAYTGSIEGTFIALSRYMARYPGQWNWWPLWGAGMPFETAYLPFSNWMVAAFSLVSGVDAARSFHIVTAAVYALGPPALFWMAWKISGRLAPSFFAGLAYTCLSLSCLLIPAIRDDASGVLALRRLHVLVYWGESPHTVALAILPLAVVCFARALTAPGARWKICAGVLSAAVVLSNAFGVVALGTMVLALLLAFPARPWWKRPATVAAIGVVSFAWISPWLSPAMIRAIRNGALVVGGDYRYTRASWIAVAALAAGFVLLWYGMRRAGAAPYLQFFAYAAYVPTAITLTWYAAHVAVIPQPARYQLQMDMNLPLAAVFAAAAVLDRLGPRVRKLSIAAAGAFFAFQIGHSIVYANRLIRAADPASLGEYRIAQWMDRNRPGERAFIGGSASLLYNVWTGNPQLHGLHEQHAVNPFLSIVAFTIYRDMNTNGREAEYSIFWLKAFGAHAISVSGPGSADPIQPYVHPGKFDGVLPLLWREGGDSIYEVPSRSLSLAHVIPAAAVPSRTPAHGLDIEPVRAYVNALDDPSLPPADFEWLSQSAARIHATVHPGQVVAVQVTYDRGWEAWAGGKRQPVRGDAIGLMVVEPACDGPCDIVLRFTGGWEHAATRSLSLAAMLVAAAFAWRSRSETRA